ncbi:trans-1,2-dihydrobenzene-1,2-diol dehydrogenase-like [Aethina tumida]|uniref:trans-1,2-dihydrobenzene-1,2-diol dehydrogenase-like n=1 Tax=Aethina tumida TaxID=116153 RepID=UPI00096B4381|nr:trans-1,2-dihydrobenzene-1,2-diol dehydrogenase-like [Aethina tumida]
MLRWGIASCSRSSYDFATALKVFSDKEHQLLAIASYNEDAVTEFAKTFRVPYTYTNYVALASEENIDIVYVAVHNEQHSDVVTALLNGGKHVVCESPLCFNEKKAKELMILSKVKSLFLMEAMWMKCFPAWEYLMTILEEGAIGIVNFMQITFGNSEYNTKFMDLKRMYKGSIMDFGVHALCFQQEIFKNLVPSQLLTTGFIGEQEVDEAACCILSYPEGKTVTISTHTRCNMPNEAVVVGTKGIIRVPHFWFPTRLILPDGEEMRFELPEKERVANRITAFQYLIREVEYCIKNNLIESEKHPHSCTLSILHWMDVWRKQIQVVYEQD